MGKVTIVCYTPKLSTSELEMEIHAHLDIEDLLPDDDEALVLVVPADEEWADL